MLPAAAHGEINAKKRRNRQNSPVPGLDVTRRDRYTPPLTDAPSRAAIHLF